MRSRSSLATKAFARSSDTPTPNRAALAEGATAKVVATFPGRTRTAFVKTSGNVFTFSTYFFDLTGIFE